MEETDGNEIEDLLERVAFLDLKEEDVEKEMKGRKCRECDQLFNAYTWCNPCNAKRFQRDFKNWTSNNAIVDKFIQDTQLCSRSNTEVIEWIPFEKFENVAHLAKGGFGTVFSAEWLDGYIINWNYREQRWNRSLRENVCLKSLNDSANISSEFLQEVQSQLKFKKGVAISIFGITMDPKTESYMIIMKRAANGSLRKILDEKFDELDWDAKMQIAYFIIRSLNEVHKKDLVHKDFHTGNVVCTGTLNPYLTDFGLCRPLSQYAQLETSNEVYGVLPYVAPEVLKGRGYTKAADIYSLGIMMSEIFTGYPPYHNTAHDGHLAMQILEGLRPDVSRGVPQLLADIMKRCWDTDPSNRPTSEKLVADFNQWRSTELGYKVDKSSEIYKQIQETETSSKKFSKHIPENVKFNYTTHSQAIYSSRRLKFSNVYEADSQQININLDDLNFDENDDDN